jgi:hypothetical protein
MPTRTNWSGWSLDSMAATGGGARDRLTDFAHAVTGAYYFVPASEALAMFAREPQG